MFIDKKPVATDSPQNTGMRKMSRPAAARGNCAVEV